MKNIALVTGAAGFIGSHVCEHCLREGMQVIGVDDLSGGFAANVPQNVTFIRGSVNDQKFVKEIFARFKIDFIYHLAAYAAEGLSHFIRHYNYETNLQGSVLLINEAVKNDVRCFVFTSSIAVYGKNQTPMSEEMVPQPEDPYGISKYAVELDLKAAHEMFGLNYVIFRPHNVYGERQNIADRYRNVIGIFINQAMQDRPMTVFGDGMQTRAFSHIDDVAPLIATSPLNEHAFQQVFNVGADQPYSILELANEVSGAFGIRPNIVHLESRKEVVHAFASHEKAKRVFGAKPNVSLKAGISRMVSWAIDRGPMEPVIFKNIEVSKNLPNSWKL